MQTRTLRYRAAFALFAALAVSGGVAQTQQKTTQPPNYYVINLGDPLGVPSAAAASINNLLSNRFPFSDAFCKIDCNGKSSLTGQHGGCRADAAAGAGYDEGSELLLGWHRG